MAGMAQQVGPVEMAAPVPAPRVAPTAATAATA